MMNIMIVTDSNYLKPTVVMLYSLFSNEPGEVDVYLPYEDIKDNELEALKKYVESWPGKRLIPMYVGPEFKEEVESHSGIKVETYYRILGWGMLPESVHKLLYLDVDMVIQKPLQELYNMDLGDKLFAVCEDIFGKINGFHEENKERLGIPKDKTYFNAGLLLVNMDELRKGDIVNEILKNVYENYPRYIYNDQDVLNELYQDRIIYVGWDRFNLPPCWYYMDKSAASQGRLEFATYEEIKSMDKDVDAFAAKYVNITPQLAKEAVIIHHLGDTKPWKMTRKPAKLFDYFDECYEMIEDAALDTYRAVTGESAGESCAPVLIYYGVTYCYNILNDILKQLEEAFKRRGIRTIAYDEQKEDINGLSRFFGKRFRAVIGIQSYLFSVYLKESNMYLHDKIMGPKINIVLDHPVWLKEQLLHVPENYYVMTHDENYKNFIDRYYKGVAGTFVLPPAANQSLVEREVQYGDRKYDVTFVGTYGDYRQKEKMLDECPEEVSVIAREYVNLLLNKPYMTAEEGLIQVLRENGIELSDEEFLDIFSKMTPVLHYVMYYYREITIKTLLDNGVRVDIWGDSWKNAPFCNHEMLTIHSEVTPEESFEIYRNSKISLNIMAWHKGGFTERIANSMAAGALVVTDRTTYRDGGLEDGKNIIMFDLDKYRELPQLIKNLLGDRNKMIEIEKNGHDYGIKYNTWDERVRCLVEEIGV